MVRGAGSSPGPGIADRSVRGEGETAEQDHVASGPVISHRRAPAGRWACRGGLFGPGRTVPDPGTAERDVGVVAAEHDDVAGGRVVGHGRAEPGWRAGRGRLPGPG